MVDKTHSQNQGYLISQILTVTRTLEVWEKLESQSIPIMKNVTMTWNHITGPPIPLIYFKRYRVVMWWAEGFEFLSEGVFKCSCGRLVPFLAQFW